jgi:hypothetical protein
MYHWHFTHHKSLIKSLMTWPPQHSYRDFEGAGSMDTFFTLLSRTWPYNSNSILSSGPYHRQYTNLTFPPTKYFQFVTRGKRCDLVYHYAKIEWICLISWVWSTACH